MDLLRSLKLNSITKKLGSIVISDDRIDCYVDNDKLRKHLEKKKNILNLDSTQKKTEYDVDKPIIYHISGYSFDRIIISTSDSIHFSNCTFNNEVTIARANQIVLENNNYNNSSNKFKYNDRFLIGANIKEFILLNDNYENEGEDYRVDMKVKAESIRFSNSNVLNGVGALNLEADEVTLENSEIDSESTLIQSKKVNIDDSSSISGSRAVMIYSTEINGAYNVYSPQKIINGLKEESNKKTSHRVKKND